MDPIDTNAILGFIGVGAMGSRIVRRLLDAGYTVMVYDSDLSKEETLASDGAIAGDSLAEIASRARVILSCLPDDGAVKWVYLGPDGIISHATQGTIFVEMSTIRPKASRELARAGAEHGIHVLDVAISGSTTAVEQGLVTLLGGGDSEVFAAVEPIFKAIAKQYFHLGPSGSGTAAKLVVNTLLGVGIQAVAEACALGQAQGLARTQLFTVLSKTAVVAPVHVGKLLRALHDDYSPQFPLRLMNKDFRLILETAAELDLALPTTEAAFQINSEAFELGLDQDFSIVIREMESRSHEKNVQQAAEHQA